MIFVGNAVLFLDRYNFKRVKKIQRFPTKTVAYSLILFVCYGGFPPNSAVRRAIAGYEPESHELRTALQGA
jgi:hypothetical protein